MLGSTKEDTIVSYDEKEINHLEPTDTRYDVEHRNVVGQDAAELEGYWTSWRYLGSLLAIALMTNSLFIGYAMPVS